MLNRSGVITLPIPLASAIVPNALAFGQKQARAFTAHPSTQEPNRLVTLETLKKWRASCRTGADGASKISGGC